MEGLFITPRLANAPSMHGCQNCVTAGEAEGSSAEKGSINKLSMGISPWQREMTAAIRTGFRVSRRNG